MIFFFAITYHSYSRASFSPINEKSCLVNKETSQIILRAVKDKDPNAIRSLSYCLKYNHKTIFQACLLDPSQLAKADKIFRSDENFIYRLVKVNPEILKYVSRDLLRDAHFMQQATYLDRFALQYADPKLLDKYLFMTKMIEYDSQNYIYASMRIKEMSDIAARALNDDGLLLVHAPDEIRNDRKMVEIAVKSNVAAFEFASNEIKQDKDLIAFVGPKFPPLNKKEIRQFIKKNYTREEKSRNLGLVIDKRTKFFNSHRLIDRNYVTKWHRFFQHNGGIYRDEKIHLTTADSRNNPKRFNEDFKKYPELTEKIRKFFFNRHVSKEAIDNLSLTYLWKIKDKPLTLAFNIYLVRDSNDEELGSDYISVTSLTAIAQQQSNKEWKMSVVETVLDSEIKAEIGYEDGKKRYILQDLYLLDKRDKNPKLLFRVEDKFKEYFEIFAEQKGGKYRKIFEYDPLAMENF